MLDDTCEILIASYLDFILACIGCELYRLRRRERVEYRQTERSPNCLRNSVRGRYGDYGKSSVNATASSVLAGLDMEIAGIKDMADT